MADYVQDYAGPAYGHHGKGLEVQAPLDMDSPTTPLIGNSKERHTGQSHRAPERPNQPLDTRPPYGGYGAMGVTADHSGLSDSEMYSQKGGSMSCDRAPDSGPDERNRQQQNIVMVQGVPVVQQNPQEHPLSTYPPHGQFYHTGPQPHHHPNEPYRPPHSSHYTHPVNEPYFSAQPQPQPQPSMQPHMFPPAQPTQPPPNTFFQPQPNPMPPPPPLPLPQPLPPIQPQNQPQQLQTAYVVQQQPLLVQGGVAPATIAVVPPQQSESVHTAYKCDPGSFFRNQLCVSAVFLVGAVLSVNLSLLPCAIISCIYAFRAADANKDKRASDALKYHKQARTCNIILLVVSIVESIIFGLGLLFMIGQLERLRDEGEIS